MMRSSFVAGTLIAVMTVFSTLAMADTESFACQMECTNEQLIDNARCTDMVRTGDGNPHICMAEVNRDTSACMKQCVRDFSEREEEERR